MITQEYQTALLLDAENPLLLYSLGRAYAGLGMDKANRITRRITLAGQQRRVFHPQYRAALLASSVLYGAGLAAKASAEPLQHVGAGVRGSGYPVGTAGAHRECTAAG